jgi:transcriptional regulator with XRE-family HTH domain
MRHDGATLAAARRRAGLSQRRLAGVAGMPQSTVGRIEAGLIDPRASTLRALLRACGEDLEAVPRLGIGVDRSQIAERLALTPRERIDEVTRAWRATDLIRWRAR